MSIGRTNRGIVVAFSGVESSGKSTQIERVDEYLRSQEHSTTYLWTRPGYTPGLRAAKRIFRRSKPTELDPESISQAPGTYPKRATSFRSGLKRWLWLTMALIDLFSTYCLYMRVLRSRFDVVLVDRYLLDAAVDFQVNFPQQHVEKRWLFRLTRWLAVRPDAAILLAIPAAESESRTRARGRSHWETQKLLEEKELLYRKFADDFNVQVVDATLSPNEVFGDLQDVVNRLTPDTKEAKNRTCSSS